MDRCEECGYEYDLANADSAGQAVRDGAQELGRVLATTNGDVRTRRQPETWSPLEYACHLRDVLLWQREQVLAARRHTTIASMGSRERVEHDGYARQEVTDVARQLNDTALMFSNDLDRLSLEDWELTLTYNYPVPAVRSLRWLAAFTLHEVRHHLLDVRRQLPEAG